LKTKVESLDCPNCGAPLDVKPGQEFTVCQYCDSSIRIHMDMDENDKAVPRTEVSAEIMNKVKELVLSGKRDEAVEMYSHEANISKEEALKAIGVIYERITTRILLDRPLRGLGVLFTIIFLAVFFVSGYELFFAGVDSTILTIILWVLFIFSALSILSVSRTIITTIKYFSGKWTEARILKFARIGEKKNITIFRLLLEVMPNSGERFQAQTNLPVRNTSVNLITEGNVLMVKYLPNDKTSVIASIEELKKRQG